MIQDINYDDRGELETHDLCSVAVEIDNALSDEPTGFFPSSISERDVNETNNERKHGKDQSMDIHEEANEASMADEEAVSDQSQLSEGIIINSEGMNKVAAFDSELVPNDVETPLAVVKTEPLDPDEDTISTEEELVPSLPLTQSALQLQFSETSGNSCVAVIKQVSCHPFENSFFFFCLSHCMLVLHLQIKMIANHIILNHSKCNQHPCYWFIYIIKQNYQHQCFLSYVTLESLLATHFCL